jgi:hypothetical protein
MVGVAGTSTSWVLRGAKTLLQLSSFIVESKAAGKNFTCTKSWTIGQGFQPAHETTGPTTTSAAVRQFPYFTARDFQAIALLRYASVRGRP